MADHKRLLVLVVDIDADLQEKAKVKGPVVGRKAVSEAATKLAKEVEKFRTSFDKAI